ncbi:hypothetical protein PISMIDRAFT_19407 [Pisolithus microcarpus 441]|uniref:Uncharacterized protein n=1 Tax=Pisolithus microcarpus 441 TaxID=765257 RepID=A0A0C9YUP8_9AGAM|nr:hypothetical protein BKA83DRAFT_19407 [Pisolithus microcarpus]KIK11573.1 hypothetical protein PISMIDRAFT_19407 [Pisolithus microcarpus 441]
MFPGGLFNNPWHSWRSPNHLEDTQTIPEYDLFDNDMTSTPGPGNHSNGTTTPTQSQLDTLSPAAHAQPNAPASVAPSDPESEYDLNVWKLHAPSHHSTPEPEHLSTLNASTGKRAEPDTPMDLGTSTKSDVVPLLTSKCRYEEVDFSRSLRQGLYEKEEVIQKLRKRIREQGRQNDAVTSLQSLLNEQERELSGLREAFGQTQSGQEQTARQYEMQLNELRKQFESSMQSHIDQLQTTRMAEIETRVQEEVTRLSSTLQAEKERELANIEQRYAQLKKSEKHLDTEMGSPAGLRPTRPQPSAPSDTSAGLCPTRPQSSTPSTPNLDAIKRIRRSRGVSKRTRLIRVDIDSNPLDLAGHEEETGEKAAPGTQDDHPTPPPVSAMVEAITKSVETTLRTLLESRSDFSVGSILRSSRRTPQRRRQENHKLQIEKATEPSYHRDFILAEVRHLFKDKLGIAQDIDFITHAPADTANVHAYEYEDGPSPDMDNIAFDLARNYSSPWNTFLLNFLLHEFQLRCACETWPIRKEDDYVEEILQERYKQLRTLWRNAQPKLTTKGGKKVDRPHVAETKTVLERIVVMKSEAPDDDLRSWKWLQRLINTLGEHGMSSEESSVENGIENVLRVKKLEWRRNIDKELEIVDLQRVLDKDIFCSQGSKPLPRKRAPDNPISSRAPVVGLPMALYDDTWILQLTECQRERLETQ